MPGRGGSTAAGAGWCGSTASPGWRAASGERPPDEEGRRSFVVYHPCTCRHSPMLVPNTQVTIVLRQLGFCFSSFGVVGTPAAHPRQKKSYRVMLALRSSRQKPCSVSLMARSCRFRSFEHVFEEHPLPESVCEEQDHRHIRSNWRHLPLDWFPMQAAPGLTQQGAKKKRRCRLGTLQIQTGWLNASCSPLFFNFAR